MNSSTTKQMTATNPTCSQAADSLEGSLCLPAAVREMTQAYHAFEQFSSRHIRKLGLTTAQFSVLLALSTPMCRRTVLPFDLSSVDAHIFE